MSNPLIAFTGLAGSGKTTAAKHLVDNGYARLSFADPLRSMLRALGVTDEQMSAGKNTPLDLLGGKTPRQALQTLGTQWGRDMISENIWANAARQRIVDQLRTRPVVLDDCRFTNEALMVRQLGGVVVEVRRPGLTRMDHISEAGIPGDLVDYVVANNSSDVATLCRAIDDVLLYAKAA